MCRVRLTSFATLNYDCVIKTMFNFLLVINNSVTIALSFLLLIILAMISSKTNNTLSFFPRLYSSIFSCHLSVNKIFKIIIVI